MSAQVPQRRTKKAKDLAEQFDISARQVRRRMAEPRHEYLARAAARREQAAQLQRQGLTYPQIAEIMGCSASHVGRILHDHRKRQT